METLSAYKTYKNLPPLAGLADFEHAAKPGLAVEECVRRLKRFHYAFWRLHQAFIAHLASEPIYELKMAWSLHGHLAAENDTNFRNRIGEMREPPLGLEKIPHPALAVFFDEILATPSTEERVLGFYEKAVPALVEALRHYIGQTHPLADVPSIRLCRIALMDLDGIAAYGRQAVQSLVTPEQRQASAQWLALLDICLAAAGGIDGTGKSTASEPTRHYSSRPFVYDGEPRRDERFPDPYNMGVNAETFLYDAAQDPELKVLMMFYKRIREIDVPEMMSSIITETRGKPWGYYRDMTRQLWDEARHAMMGEVGFVRAGIDWGKLVRVNFTWSLALNTQLTPIERHAVLYYIEQGLMPKTGKRFEWEVGKASGDDFSRMIQDYDWADEVLHAYIGRDWYVKPYGDAKKAIEYGDHSWSKVLIDWSSYRDRGLTAHENWWPALYLAWCEAQGRPPDPAVLAYDTSYDGSRADLKDVSVSA